MSEIKSKKAKEFISVSLIDTNTESFIYRIGNYHIITIPNAYKAVELAETESEERHQQQLQELRYRAVEAFMEVCPLGHPERFKNVGLQTSAVCPYIDIIGFPCCNDRCPFILALTQKLTEK